MPAPFGFSVGDFIAVIELITKVGKALKDSGGAASEYQDAVQELESLQTILTDLGNLHFKERTGTSPALRLTNLISTCQRPLRDFLDRIVRFQASLDASTQRKFLHTIPRKAQWGVFMGAEVPKLRSVVAAKVLQLQLVLESYSAESLLRTEAKTAMIQSFVVDAASSTHTQLAEVKNSSDAIQQSVERNSQVQTDSTEALEKKIDQTTAKVSSQLNMLERCQNHYFPTLISFVRSISGIVTTSNNRIQDVQDCQRRYFPRLLFAIQVTLEKIDDLAALGTQLLAASRTWPEDIRQLLRLLCETNAQVYSVLLALQRQRWPYGIMPLSAQDSMHFEDALGRQRDLPYEYFRSWEIFEAMLKFDFKDRPGEENINQGRFYILNETNQQQIMSTSRWEQSIFPGTTITMSMILSLVSGFGEMCPRPGCRTRGRRISQTSQFLKCPECNLLYEREDINTQKDGSPVGVRAQSEDQMSQDSPSQSAFDFEISRPRLSTSIQETQDLPKATKTHTRRGKVETENAQYRQNARQKEIDDLAYFKRVHLLPAEERQVEAHWIAHALTQSRSATPFMNIQRSACYCRVQDTIEDTETEEEYDKIAHLHLGHHFMIGVLIRPMDLRAKILCQDLSPHEDGFLTTSCAHVTRLLLERKNTSTIELYGPSSVRLWAVLSFRNFEGLVLFFCCFQALKAQDLGEPVSLIANDHLEGEERLFGATIIDGGYEHILRIYSDKETGAVRLQASVSSGEMQNTPVWIAFITHVLHSPTWKIRANRTVYLTDLQRLVFTSTYKQRANRFGLEFTTSRDAEQFLVVIDNLGAHGLNETSDLPDID